MSRLMQAHSTLRARFMWLTAASAAVALGLASRMHADALPPFLAAYAGDTIWAMVVYAVAGAAAPAKGIAPRAMAALAFSFAIEFSQSYRADWIESLRGTTLGALILGRGFLWSDLACYAAGIALAAAAEAAVRGAAQRLARRAASDNPPPPR